MRSHKGHSIVLAASLLVIAVSGGDLRAQGCPLPPFEPPLPDVGVPLVSPDYQQFLDEFAAAHRYFEGMSLETFREEYGPRKVYRTGGPYSFIRGDANGDSSVDIADPICTLLYLFLGQGGCSNPACHDPLDSNDDGRVDITDPIYLLGHLFLGQAVPPAPYPTRGPDPTDDALDCPPALEVVPKLDYEPMTAEYVDAITNAFPLDGAQEEAFRENGFVILANRRSESFLLSFGELFSRDMPIYISADSLMDALHLSFDRILMTIEEESLIGELDSMLSKMDAGIEDLAAHSGGADISQNLDDVAFWIATARSLLAGEKVPCRRGVDAAVEEFLAYVAAEKCIYINLFGNVQVEDFSQFKPRSHYAKSEALSRYFRAMMWVQRMGVKFAQLPRHSAAAYLLSKCLLDTEAMEHWARIDSVVEFFVGTSDSLNAQGMLDLAASAGIASVSDLYDGESFKALVNRALESGAGRQRINSQVLRSNPTSPDFTPIPPAYHVMGQRFIVDSFIFTNVVYDRVCRRGCFSPCPDPRNDVYLCGRLLPSPLDAWFVLGNRCALPLLESELETYEYHRNLAAMDWLVSRYDEGFWSANFYNVWLSALRALSADTTQAPYPSVMQTEEWDRRMLHAQLASWAQLRHDTLLYAKPSYTSLGECEYPDAWVDPYPEFYLKLAEFGRGGLERLEPLGIFDLPSGKRIRWYFESLESRSGMLASIAQAELENMPLTAEQTEFFKELWKSYPVWSQGYYADGWYQELIFQKEDFSGLPWVGDDLTPEGVGLPEEYSPTIADIHTDPNTLTGNVLHVGVTHPNLMLISVKTSCATKAYVGPVFSYHEVVMPDIQRLTDEEWKAQTQGLIWNPDDPGPPRPEWTQAFIR